MLDDDFRRDIELLRSSLSSTQLVFEKFKESFTRRYPRLMLDASARGVDAEVLKLLFTGLTESPRDKTRIELFLALLEEVFPQR